MKLISRSDKIGPYTLGVKEDPYWEFVHLDHYILLIHHNVINLGYNILYNLLDYGNDKIDNKSIEEEIVRNSLHLIDSLIVDKVKLKLDFDISVEGEKFLN